MGCSDQMLAVLMEYFDWICLVGLSALLYLIVLIILLYYYRSYLLSISDAKKRARENYIISVFIFIALFTVVCYVFYHIALLIPLLLVITILLLVMPILIYGKRQQYLYRCLDESVEKLDGMEYVVCNNRAADAWYNPNNKRIYVSSRLREVLTCEELKAVIYHVQEYVRHHSGFIIAAAVFGYWFEAVVIIIILGIIFQVVPSTSMITLSLSLIGASLTLPAIVISWINEHEVDREVIRNIGSQPFVAALIKIHVYGSYGEYLNDVILKNVNEVLKIAEASIKPRQLLFTVAKYSWIFPRGISDLFKSPQYRALPPLQLRLAALLPYIS